MVWHCEDMAKMIGGGEETDLAKISKLVQNKWIKPVYLVPLAHNVKWKMIPGVNCTHI